MMQLIMEAWAGSTLAVLEGSLDWAQTSANAVEARMKNRILAAGVGDEITLLRGMCTRGQRLQQQRAANGIGEGGNG